ncbi:MAG: NAD(P)H-dependent glycerol-3-phosphate dehydrogenase [Myxococcota bacterium]
MTAVAVLGSGSFGSALAKVLADQGNATRMWTRDDAHARVINDTRKNERYLGDLTFPSELEATADIAAAVDGAELVLFVVPSHATRSVAEAARAHISDDALLCCATKGIENDSLMLMSEVMTDVFGADASPRMTYFSGPSFAREIAAGVPTAVTVAGERKEAAERVQQEFATANLRMYYTEDVVGVEVGGALKNVVAIAAGAADGLGFGLNTRAALITRGLAEITRLAAKKGANPLTMAGLAGMGDLVLTCTGSLSRNRTVGFELGKGRTLPEILASLGQVAEGVKTTKSAFELGAKLGVPMPITDAVYRVLYEDKPAREAVRDLMTRPLKHEQR